MSLSLLPITELEAVNLMLQYADYEAVEDLDDPVETEAALAQQILHRHSRSTQSAGLPCNTLYQQTIALSTTPPPANRLIFPAATLRAEPDEVMNQGVLRSDGTSLYWYDLVDNTAIFTASKKFKTVTFLAFDQLPDQVRTFITWRACYEFLVGENADQGRIESARLQIAEAQLEFHRYMVLAAKANVARRQDTYLLANRMKRFS